MIPITGEVDVVNPNILRVLNSNRIASISQNLGDLYIADDDIAGIDNSEADAVKGCMGHLCELYDPHYSTLLTRAALTQDSGVGTDFDNSVSSNCAYAQT